MSLRILAVMFVVSLLAACESYYGRPSTYEGSYGISYREVAHEGRIYVLGKRASWDAWQKHPGQLPYTRTLIGEGPNGETVVIEADAKDPSIDRELTAMFEARNYYAEENHDGRLYVIGRRATHDQFQSSKSLATSRTLIGEGPGGVTLVIEADPRDAALETRLLADVQRRHGFSVTTEK